MKTLSRNGQVLIGAIAMLLLTALSMAAIALLGYGATLGGVGNPGTNRCAAPSFAGTVVDVTATDRGGPMTCAEGGGEGILPSTSGWVTLDLQPGRYELLCNLPGHYRAGMYT